MNDPMFVSIMAGVAVVALIVGLGLGLPQVRRLAGRAAARRLDLEAQEGRRDLRSGILLRPPAIDLESPQFWTKLLPNLENLNRLYEQADVNLPFNQFMGIVVVLSLAGARAWVPVQASGLPGPVRLGRPRNALRSSGSSTARSGGSGSFSTRCPRPSS